MPRIDDRLLRSSVKRADAKRRRINVGFEAREYAIGPSEHEIRVYQLYWDNPWQQFWLGGMMCAKPNHELIFTENCQPGDLHSGNTGDVVMRRARDSIAQHAAYPSLFATEYFDAKGRQENQF